MHAPAPARAPVPEPGGAAAADSVFANVLVGIDETPESLVGAAQAAVLRPGGSRLALVAVVEAHLAAHAGLAALHAEEDVAAGTFADLERAKVLVEADDVVVARGRLVDLLRGECEQRKGSLVAIGTRPHRRLSALTFGGHDVEALHDVSCSLLIARAGWGPSKPARIVIGVDGSAAARTAEDVGRSLGRRLGCEVLPVVSLGDEVDATLLRAERDDALVDPGDLVHAVVDASNRRTLIVVGRDSASAGRRGDLAERVVYAAQCSVLVVRHEVAAGGVSPAASNG